MSLTDPSLLNTLIAKVSEAKTLNKTSIDEFNMHKRYYHGDQLPWDILATLRRRQQPKYWENIYKETANKITGFQIATRKEVTAVGRQNEDKTTALLLTDIFRTVANKESYLTQKISTNKDLLFGLGAYEVGVIDTGERDVLGKKVLEGFIEHVPGGMLLVDPYSIQLDATDAKDLHRILFVDREDIELYFPEKAASLTYKKYGTRERAIVYNSWYLVVEHGKKMWKRTLWSDRVELITTPNPFMHKSHPFAVRKLFIDNSENKNDYYGLYRDIQPLQDALNFAMLRMQNMLGSTKLLMEKDAVEDMDVFQEDYAKDDGVAEVNAGTLSTGKIKEIKHNADLAQLGNMTAGYKKSAPKLIGATDELFGAAVNRMSGYAIEQRQNVGMVGLQEYMNACDTLETQAFTKFSYIIQQYYTAEQMLRISERKDVERYFTINEYQRGEYGEVLYGQDGQPLVNNQIKVGRYDIIMRTIPVTQGSRSERYKQNTEILKTVASADGTLVEPMLPILLSDADSPMVDDVIQLLQERKAQPNQAQDQAMQTQLKTQQKMLEKLDAEIGLIKAKSIKAVAEGQEEAGRVRNIDGSPQETLTVTEQ